MTDYVIEDGYIKFSHTFSDEAELSIHLIYDDSKDPQDQIDSWIQNREIGIEFLRQNSDGND